MMPVLIACSGEKEELIESCNPEGTAVSTHTLEGPVIKGLIRCTTVIGQTIIIRIERFQITKRLHSRRPTLRQKAKIIIPPDPHYTQKIQKISNKSN